MINKIASHSMIGDIGRFQQVSMTEGISAGKVNSGGIASDMAGMMMGMQMADQMMNDIDIVSNFCPNCGHKIGKANFCSNCGKKLIG